MIRILLVFLLLSTPCYAANQTAASCSAADIQSAIDTCIGGGGGVVSIPACSADNTWDANEYLEADTAVEWRLEGAGIGSTVIGYEDSTIPAAGRPGMYFIGGGLVEISGFTFRGSDSGTGVATGIRIYNNLTANLRVHHIRLEHFRTTHLYICSNDAQEYPTLVDNCEFVDQHTGGGGSYGIRAHGTGDNTDFVIPASLGADSPNAIFIEDSTFDAVYHAASGFGISKIVFRYNTITNPTSYVDGHGPCYDIGCNNDPGFDEEEPPNEYPDAGTYIYEIYNNDIDCGTYPWGVNIRGGTGVMTDNTFDSCSVSMRLQIENCSEGVNCTSGNNCPMEYDPGVSGPTGCFQSPDQWWIWGNTVNDGAVFGTNDLGSGCIRECSGATQPTSADCEYRLDALAGYTKYTYPHPLRGSSISRKIIIN